MNKYTRKAVDTVGKIRRGNKKLTSKKSRDMIYLCNRCKDTGYVKIFDPRQLEVVNRPNTVTVACVCNGGMPC